jgi:Cu+-exporting ATPase
VTEGLTKLHYADALIVATTSANAKREYMFEVTGMSCANCAMKIEKAILALAACDNPPCEVAVSSMTNKAKVVLRDPASTVGPRSITEKITAMGYGCTLHGVDGVSVAGHGDSGDAQENNELGEWYIPLVVSLILGIPVMALHLSMAFSDQIMMTFDMPAACSGGVSYEQAVMFLLNLPILLIVGYRYYKGAVIGAMHGNFGMDCLVTTGTSITFLYSCVQVSLACHSHIPTKHVFFETTGMLLMFVTIGKFIEAYAKRRSFAAISNLLKLQPREVSYYL